MQVIEITDLSKFYGKARGIEHVDLEIGEGEIFGFIGPNGSGKSTTIRILLNMIFPDSGNARIMGLDVIRETKKIKQLVGYVPSDANIYNSMDVHEFLNYCLHFYQGQNDARRITELSEMFELDLKRKIAELSMGNRKKVSIVQSLLHRPKLLILDEPTTGLDPLMQAKFFELLRSENRNGMTIFFSSHILNEVQLLCKRVAIIKEGKIIQLEDIETLRKKQLKKVYIEFGDPVNQENFSIQGLENVITRYGNLLSFMYSGNINELVGLLAEKKIIDVTIEEPSLEEIFMHYYK
ncbi:MAG TPA: ABC transporter ATP-binding protein [Bacteroidales bacterium]|nr:ABC transporter ATP-binding protein [Bacteroidales bacterium]